MPTLELARSAVDRRRQSLVKPCCCFGGAASRPRAESINVGRRSSCCCRRRERSADQTQDTSTRDNALNKARNWVGDSRLLILWPPTAGRSNRASRQPIKLSESRENNESRERGETKLIPFKSMISAFVCAGSLEKTTSSSDVYVLRRRRRDLDHLTGGTLAASLWPEAEPRNRNRSQTRALSLAKQSIPSVMISLAARRASSSSSSRRRDC